MTRTPTTTILFGIIISTGSAFAEGDPNNGKKLAGTYCARCHGLDGNARSTSIRPVPMLAGQPVSYLFKEMQNYASGARKDSTGDAMLSFMETLTDQDFEDIAAYYAAQPRY